MAFRTLRISELEPISVVDETLRWHPLRHALGVTAFGVNAYSAPTAGHDVVEEHTEASGSAGGHEELYVVLTGRARFTIDGESSTRPPAPACSSRTRMPAATPSRSRTVRACSPSAASRASRTR
jgi:hypothetical protein